jgi:hypothetical protein
LKAGACRVEAIVQTRFNKVLNNGFKKGSNMGV